MIDWMALQTPIRPACNTAFKALSASLANFKRYFLIPGIFFSPHINFLRHLILPTAPFCVYVCGFPGPLFWFSFSPTVLSQSPAPSPDSLILLPPKTWCCSESLLGLSLFSQDNRLSVPWTTSTCAGTMTIPESLLQGSLPYPTCIPYSVSQPECLSPHTSHIQWVFKNGVWPVSL